MNVLAYYRALSGEQKCALTVACREVGLGATLEFLAYQAGLPANLKPHESARLQEVLLARNVQFQRKL